MALERRTFLLAGAAASGLDAAPPVKRPATFEIWDVFTQERLRGNPLAVFPDAMGIPESQLGAIAREMAHSETTFVYPRPVATERREGVRTRIFSRAGTELPFAGHPVLGTAFAIWTVNQTRSDLSGNAVTLSLPVGPVPVAFHGSEGVMTQPDPVFAERHEAKVLAPLLGLNVEDIDAALPLENVSTGRPNVLVMIKERGAVRRASFDWRNLDAYFAAGDRERGVYLLTRDVELPSAQFHARKVTKAGDDPVTGSAAGCAIAWLVMHGVVEPGKRVVIEQGSEINRLGQLFASAEMSGGKVSAVKVGGSAVLAARGTLD